MPRMMPGGEPANLGHDQVAIREFSSFLEHPVVLFSLTVKSPANP